MLRFSSWRFRLSTLLLVVTVTALGLALFLSLRRERKLAAENRELNALLGRPVVTDPQRIAIGQDGTFPHINSTFPGRILAGHRFRVYRPTDRKLVLRYAFEEPNGTLPQSGNRLELSKLPGNELTIDIVVKFDMDGILAVDSTASGSNAIATHFSSERFMAADDHWIFSDAYRNDALIQLGLEDTGQTPPPSQPDTPLVLVRYTSRLNSSTLPRTAVLVWIEDAP